jgi:hypothetical protein
MSTTVPGDRRPPTRPRWLPGRRLAWGAAAAVLALFVVVLVRAPVPAASAPGAGVAGTDPESAPHTHVGMADMAGMSGAAVPVGGTAAAAGGYTFVPDVTTLTAGTPIEFRFVITGPGGAPVTRFAIVRDRPMHFIVVRRDLSGFQHLHPTMAANGTWSVPLTLPVAGSYRAYADFSALDGKGNPVAAVLGVDLTVPGGSTAIPLPPADHTSTADGLVVSYLGQPKPGVAEPLLFTVTRAGRPVTPQPYLGAYGHLVVLRPTDLGYLHVHPEPALAGGAVKFWLAAPGAGTFRMYLDLMVDGTVHTASFTLAVS